MNCNPTEEKPYRCFECVGKFSLREGTYSSHGFICLDCLDSHEDSTGYCSVECCLGGGCDGTC
jgi:hypothetical protein